MRVNRSKENLVEKTPESYLINKLGRLEDENKMLWELLVAYREWHVANHKLLNNLPTSKPPYNEEEMAEIIDYIHAKYCPNCISTDVSL